MPVMSWNDEKLGLTMTFRFQIEDSNISVSCEVNRCEPDDVVHLFIRASDLVRGAVALICFARGIGATVTLDTLVDADGNRSSIMPEDPRLVGVCTVFNLAESGTTSYYKVLEGVLSEPSLFFAMNELVSSITIPHMSVINCARVVNRLRHLIAPGLPKKQGWEAVRRELRVGEEYLKFITDQPAGPRHGDPMCISGFITTEVTWRAWVIMNRFLEYRSRGSIGLSATEFPILDF